MSSNNSTSGSAVNLPGAIVAGVVASAVMAVCMKLFFKTDIMGGIGGMALGAGASAAMKYIVGGAMHLMIGIVYGFVFAWLSGMVKAVPRLVTGLVLGAVLTPVAIYGMPVMQSMLTGSSAGNPCNPCGGAANPCNPCGGDMASNPCNPCAGAANPCNPCGGETASNPCNPCGSGAGGMDPNLVNLINHLIFGLALGLVYKPKGA